jgi:rare lipoprotein A
MQSACRVIWQQLSNRTNATRLAACLSLIPLLCSCSVTPVFDDRDGAPDGSVDVSNIPDAIPRAEPRSAYGNPAVYEVYGTRYVVRRSSAGYVERGIASWYGTKFHGRSTSSGEPYDMLAMTAAHRTLPLPTYARVTNLSNGRSVIVKINDRGPFVKNRLIDLSYAAARKLGIVATGTGLVEVRAIDPRKPVIASEPHGVALQTANHAPAKPSQLYIQVGAFASQNNAQRLIDSLKQLALPGVEIQPGFSNQRPIYRVRVGPLASIEEADRMTEKLAQQGLRDSRIIVD